MNASLSMIFKNKWLKIVLMIICLQQLLVAGGTFCLGLLSSTFPTEGFQPYLAVFLFLCILLPGTLVHYWVIWCTTRASKKAQLDYLQQYMSSNYNQPTHWRDQNSKNQRHDIMCRGGQDAIQTTINFLVDLVATGLNIILNTISIILVTDVALGIVIIIAGILGLGLIHLSEKGISSSSRVEMLSDNQLNSHLSRSWDNIILGNLFFFERWRSLFMKYFEISENASLQTVKTRDLAISLAAFLTNGLILGYALGLAWVYRNDVGFVLAILVMLPRCLQIVMHIQIIQTYVAKWKNLKEKLKVTQESLLKPDPINLNPFIQNTKICVLSDNKKHPIQDIEHLINERRNGRFTIIGPNASGKSSFLLNLKSRLKTVSIYLPAQHQLILQESQLKLSSGEITLAALNDINKQQCDILLLDEWDANLSIENRNILDEVINQLSQNKIVIEIRHGIIIPDYIQET